MIYKKCSELPLNIFIRIILEDDIKLIVIDGEYSESEIANTWSEIYSEYFELSGSSDCKHMINTAKSIVIAENKISIINACCAVLMHNHNDSMYKALSSIGFKLKRIDDKNERLKAIESLTTRAKSLVHIISENSREFNKLNNNSNKLTEQDYIESIASLSKFQGYKIDTKETTVAEYLAIQKHYKTELEWRQKKA